MKILSSDRIFIAGKTGSGKTFLAHHLTKDLKRLVVLDGKGTLGKWDLQNWNSSTKQKLLKGEDIRIRVTFDPLEGMGVWEEALETVYLAGNCTLYIDEIYAIVPPRKDPSNFMWAIWTRGREHGIGGWASTQRPSFVPLFVMSEADYYFCFRLTLEDDRKKLASFMGDDIMTPIKDKHGFWFMGSEDDYPTYLKALKP